MLFELSEVRIKALKLRVQSKFPRFLEFYVYESTNSRKVVFYRMKLLYV